MSKEVFEGIDEDLLKDAASALEDQGDNRVDIVTQKVGEKTDFFWNGISCADYTLALYPNQSTQLQLHDPSSSKRSWSCLAQMTTMLPSSCTRPTRTDPH